MVTGAVALANFAHTVAAKYPVNIALHTDHCPKDKLDTYVRPLLAISHDGVEFAEPQVARFTRTGSLINSAELGRALATTIGDGVGCLIPQHGLVTVGPDAATAVMRALLLARACDVQLRAMAAGQIRLWSDPAEIALKKAEVWPESQISAGYAYLCRRSG